MANVGVARESESRAVDDFLGQAGAGPVALVFEGEPGIGKTTVWLDAVQRATEAGFAVLSARGAAAEARLTFAGLADLLTDVDAALIDGLAPAQRAALDGVLLRGDGGPATDERTVATAFLTVVDRLSRESPVLVAIDDAQWLDVSSRVIVGFAARRLKGRVAVLITSRTDETDVPDIGSWFHMPRPDTLTRMRLSPLTLGSLHAVLARRLGHTLPRPVIARIHAVSGGNPFYALELARALDTDAPHDPQGLPESLADLVLRRLNAVEGGAADLLLTAACAAQPTVDLLSRAADLTPARVMELLEVAEAAGIVRVDGLRVSFTHPLLAQGAYTQASPPHRRSVHARLAAIVDHPEVRARHLALAADSDPATLEALDAAADSAAKRGASSAAAELLDMAINLGGDTTARRLRAAEQHFRAGSLDTARARLDSVIDTAPSGTLRAVALMLLGAVAGHGEDLVRAVDALREAVDEARDNPVLRLQALLLLTPAIGLTGQLDASLEHARRAVADAEQLGVDALLSQALVMRAHVGFMYGLGADEAALDTALRLEVPGAAASIAFSARAVAAVHESWTGKLDVARAQLANAARYFADHGSEVDLLWVALHAVPIDLWLGRFDDAARTTQDAIQRAEQIGGTWPLIHAMTCQAAVSAHAGRADACRAAAQSAIDAARACGGAFLEIAPRTSLGFVEVSLRNYPAALSVLGPLLASFDPHHDTEIMVGGYLPDAVEALIRVGRLDEAEPLTAALQANGNRLDRPWMLATGARCRALLCSTRSDFASATRHAELAMSHHERLPIPFERARTQLLLGQLYRRVRQRQAARAPLADALATFEELGSPLWAARARAEMQRVGAPRVDGLELTPAEQRVAERAAAGMSNKEIAAELFLSVKTVEMRLSTVYRKLGIRSRAQLYARLRSTGQGKP